MVKLKVLNPLNVEIYIVLITEAKHIIYLPLYLPIRYKNRRCGMIVHETATHQVTVEF